MATISTPSSNFAAAVKSAPLAPPLAQGDRLTRAEFLRRYQAAPPSVKAERIEGIVYMASAVTAAFHGNPHALAIGWLVQYMAMTPGVVATDNSTIALDLDNDPQPDAALYITQVNGGQSIVNADGYLEGAPELIVEITASSTSYDLGPKLNAYRRSGVREYLVHRTYDGQFDWFVLRDGQYQPLAPDAAGIYHSEVFPGLWLDAQALIDARAADVFSALQRGTATKQHGDFVVKLAETARQHSASKPQT